MLSGEMVGLTQRQSYRLRGLQEQARGWDYRGLQRALARMLASDMAMKGIAPDQGLGVTRPATTPPPTCACWSWTCAEADVG